MAKQKALMDRLGPHTTGASCIYIKRLGDIDLDVLGEIVALHAVGDKPFSSD